MIGNNPFDDKFTAAHARSWARRHIGHEFGQLFVEWLQSLDYDDQQHIYSNGYVDPSVLRRFEEAHPEVQWW